jgi:photosystem II stability/assembly factor-like uncharacterized protein
MKKFLIILFLTISTNTLVAQWQQTSGPSGGGVYQFAFLSGKILAATTSVGNGVFASTDNGTSWHESGLQGLDLYRIVANGNTVLAAVMEDTIYRSSDAGVTWQKVWTIPNAIRIQSICFHKQKWYLSVYQTDDSMIGGIYRSDDDGINWTRITESNTFTYVRTLLSTGNYLLAGTQAKGLYRSSDDGSTWQLSQNGLTSNPFVWSAQKDGNKIWLGIEGGVIFSTDDGSSWTMPANTNFNADYQQFAYDIAITGNTIIAITNDTTLRSTDGGGSWKPVIGNGMPKTSFHYSVSYHNGIFYFSSLDGVVTSSDNGLHWSYHTDGLRAAVIMALGTFQGKIFAATANRIHVSSDQGATWSDPKNSGELNNNEISGVITSQNNFYAYGDGFYKWNGSSWNTISSISTDLVVEGDAGRLFASRGQEIPSPTGGLEYSDDGGVSWKPSLYFTNTLDTTFVFVQQCFASHGRVAVILVDVYEMQTNDQHYQIYRTSDNGLTWAMVDTVKGSNPAFISFGGNTFYIGTYGNGLFRSDDDGLTWHQDLSLPSDISSTYMVNMEGRLFTWLEGSSVQTDGLYSSSDGNNWTFANKGTYNINALSSDGTYLYGGGPSVWKRPLSSLGIADTKANLNTGSLEVFPNPSGDIIHLKINCQDNFMGTLIIVDANGEIVSTTIVSSNNNKPISFSVADLSAGVYMCRVIDKSGSIAASSKFVKE